MVGKIANLGVQGAAKYQTSKYEGVLQKDLGKILANRVNCKVEVFNSLKDKLIPAGSAAKAKKTGKSIKNQKDHGSPDGPKEVHFQSTTQNVNDLTSMVNDSGNQGHFPISKVIWEVSPLFPAIPLSIRSFSSSLEVTRIWRKNVRAIFEKAHSTKLSQEPCLGV